MIAGLLNFEMQIFLFKAIISSGGQTLLNDILKIYLILNELELFLIL